MQKEESVDFKQPNVLILATTRECVHSINHEIIQRNKEFSKSCRRENMTYSISEAMKVENRMGIETGTGKA